jgi:hypothetical protein
MKPISAAERRVVNLRSADFEPWDRDDAGERGTSVLQLNPDAPRGTGFYIYKMVIEGTLIDNDGTVYERGEVVWLAAGTEHNSRTETGCLIAVYAEAEATTLAD